MTTTYYTAKGLTGGGADDLDFIDGTGLGDGDRAFVDYSNRFYFYVLDADSALTEVSPYIISPDTNAGDKRWILQPPLAVSTLTKTQASSPVTLTATYLYGPTILNNSGATGEVIFNLPAGFAGATFRAEVIASQYLRIAANGSEVISYAGGDTAAGGYIRCNTAGGFVRGYWNGSKWIIDTIIGAWNYDA